MDENITTIRRLKQVITQAKEITVVPLFGSNESAVLIAKKEARILINRYTDDFTAEQNGMPDGSYAVYYPLEKLLAIG